MRYAGNVRAVSKRAGRSRQLPAASLIELSRVLEESARILKEHAEAGEPAEPVAPEAKREITPALVRSLLIARRLRSEFFAIGPGGAAWTMMLELFAARLEGKRVNQQSLGRRAGVSATTALRLVRALAKDGVLTIERDPESRRSLIVALTDEAAGRMRDYLELALGAAPLV